MRPCPQYPEPRHGGGIGRRPLDPPPPVDSSQGCPACWILSVLVLVLFPKELLCLRRVPPGSRKGCPGRQFPNFLPKKAPRWPPRCLQDGQDGLQDGYDGFKMPPRRPKLYPRRAKIASRWPKRPLRGLQDSPRELQEVLQEGPKRPKS